MSLKPCQKVVLFLSNIKNHVELVENEKNGFIVNNNFDIIEKIKFLLNNKDDMKKVSKNAYSSVLTNNLLEDLVSKENLVIKKLIAD